MQDLLIVGDIAGQYDALLRLVSRVPETTFILACGDLVDRGPKSKDVVEWFMRNSHRADALHGNHENMMIDCLDDLGIYEPGTWYANGGWATMQSYGSQPVRVPDPTIAPYVPSSHLAWLATRKRYMFFGDDPDKPELFVSHAALNPKLTVAEAAEPKDLDDPLFLHGLLWNRGEPRKAPYFQVMGHNAHWGLRKFGDWAICLDTSWQSVLTGLRWPSREIIQEPYEVRAEASP